MDNQEKIAYVRSRLLNSRRIDTAEQSALRAVCELAECALDLQPRLDSANDTIWALEHSLAFERETHRLTDKESEISDDDLERWKKIAQFQMNEGDPNQATLDLVIRLCDALLKERHPKSIFEDLWNQGAEDERENS